MMKTDSQYEAAKERLRVLEEERVAMVMRREKPVLIHAISAAYLKEYRRIEHEDQVRKWCYMPDTRTPN